MDKIHSSRLLKCTGLLVLRITVFLCSPVIKWNYDTKNYIASFLSTVLYIVLMHKMYENFLPIISSGAHIISTCPTCTF